MKKIILTFLFTLVLTTTVHAQVPKIGYIDIDYVVTNSPQFDNAKQTIIQEFQPQEKELIKNAEQIQLLADEFNKNKASFSQDQMQAEVEKITALEEKLKANINEIKGKIDLRNEQEITKIQKIVNETIQKVATTQSYDLIVYQKVAYASSKVDITQIISQELKTLFAEGSQTLSK